MGKTKLKNEVPHLPSSGLVFDIDLPLKAHSKQR